MRHPDILVGLLVFILYLYLLWYLLHPLHT